ncbi:E3 ubiquitin-protein ligase rnf14 [Entophlyctis luteolus]|nr:E3 ubiquitin-protein ligase rnf14 [Entophlyctis luteolus]
MTATAPSLPHQHPHPHSYPPEVVAANRAEQRDELDALASIFDAQEFSFAWAGEDAIGCLSVRMELPAAVVLLPAAADDPVAAPLPIRHLPLVSLHFVLGPGYPSHADPIVVVKPEADWLPAAALHILRTKIVEQSKALVGTAQLFALAQYVQHDALAQLSLVSPATATGPPILSSTLPRDALVAASDARDLAVFAESTITCGICRDTRIGAACLRFAPCRHAYCRACLRAYFEICIREGNVRQVSCPNEECKRVLMRPNASANPAGASQLENNAAAAALVRPISSKELAAVVPDDNLVRRYESLLEQMALLQKPNLTYCPRQLCNAPTLKDPEEEKLCICPKCKYAFCFFCNKSWHGYAAYCQIRHLESIAKEYLEASDAAKRSLEVKYGKKTLEKVVREIEEDKLNREYFKDNAQACPNCTCMVERTEGCCHMICKVCDVHFCYVCGDKLNASNPYAHYSTRGSQCYGKLFDGTNTENYDPLNDPDLVDDEFGFE